MTSVSRVPSRSLHVFFAPASVAVIGASDDPTRIGGRPVRYLLESGFTGRILPVNPHRSTVQGVAAHPSIGDVPGQVDLAVVALPAAQVVAAVRDCAAAAGVRGVVVFSAGFAEGGPEGEARQGELAALVEETGIRVLGPNCLGVVDFHTGLTATFASTLAGGAVQRGNIAVVSQSGALGSHIFPEAIRRRMGFSIWATTGNEVDVDFAECLLHAARDPRTDVILAYAEGVRDGARLHEALRVARDSGKPVVMLKVGRSRAGAIAASSHTGSLVGADGSYDAVFRHYGVIRVDTIAEWITLGEACAQSRLPVGSRIGLVTGSGGVGILMADAASELGLDAAPLPPSAQRRLLDLVPFAAVANPVDVTAQISNQPELLGSFLQVVLEEGEYDALVIFLGHAGLHERGIDNIRPPLAELRRRYPDRLLVLSCLTTDASRAAFAADGLLVVEDPSEAVALVARLVRFARARLGGSPAPRLDVATGIDPLPPGPYGERRSKELLAAAGVPVVSDLLALSVPEAVAAARAVGRPVAMKVASPRIAHKSDIGGVLLDVEGDEAVASAYRDLVARAAVAAPGSERDGVLVSPMVEGGTEILVGIQIDPVLGPTVTVGLGGVTSELFKDVVTLVAPTDPETARRMIGGLRCWPLLDGYRGRPKADVEALVDLVVRVSDVAGAWQQDLESLDINPVIVLPEGEGVLALDALIVPR